MKPHEEWNNEELKKFDADQKARNSHFHAISLKERRRISHCKTAKKVWDVLRIAHEENKKLKSLKLQRVIQEFWTMLMEEDEMIDEFYARLMDVHHPRLHRTTPDILRLRRRLVLPPPHQISYLIPERLRSAPSWRRPDRVDSSSFVFVDPKSELVLLRGAFWAGTGQECIGDGLGSCRDDGVIGARSGLGLGWSLIWAGSWLGKGAACWRLFCRVRYTGVGGGGRCARRRGRWVPREEIWVPRA
ncbi:hypothetical protein ACLB2K_037564 [Fragaria x ananassa]